MSCPNCRDIEAIDHVPPDCAACPMPPLSFEEARVLEMHSVLLSAGHLAGPDTVLRAYGAGREELLLLAAVEEEMRKMRREKQE